MFRRLSLRPPLMLIAVVGLIAGLWGGLQRLGWVLPSFNANFAAQHGVLMISGFFGTLISLERAVAIHAFQPARRWVYMAPLLSGVGSLLLILGGPELLGRSLILLGSVVFLGVLSMMMRQQPNLEHGMMALGGVLWVVGNGLWWAAWPIYRVAAWWIGFLLLTVAGERLELGRVFLRRATPRYWLIGIVGAFFIGLWFGLWQFELGTVICGLAIAALGMWLLAFDVVRYTIRKTGLTRFMALCLLLGHGWLVLAGALWLWFAPRFSAGFGYDAMLHSVLVGFIFSMIFGHAPVILPSFLNRPLAFSAWLYGPLALLHGGLLLRIWADVQSDFGLRMWAGLLNEIAIIGFVTLLLLALRRATRPL